MKSLAPRVTVSLSGVGDPPGAVALAKVIAIRRRNQRVELPRLTPMLIKTLIASGAVLKQVPGARSLVRAIRARW